MIKKMHIYVTMLATIIFLVFSIVRQLSPAVIAIRLIYVIVIFYVIGLVIRYYMMKKIFSDKLQIVEEVTSGVEEEESVNNDLSEDLTDISNTEKEHEQQIEALESTTEDEIG